MKMDKQTTKVKKRSYKDLEMKNFKIGCLNVRGCNRPGVMEEIGSIFEEKNLDILALSETKLNWTGCQWFGNIWGKTSGSNFKTNAREGVAILLKKDLFHLVDEWKMFSSRIMSLKIRIRRETWVFVCAYAPDQEEFDRSVIEHFWNSLTLFLMGIHPYDKVVLLGDLNARVGNKVIEGIVGSQGVKGTDYNGEKLIELCRFKGLLIGNTYFRKEFFNKYTWESHYVDKSGEHIKALVDYICITEQAKFHLLDVHTTKLARGGARGISDHYLVVGKLKLKFVNKLVKEYNERIEQKRREEKRMKRIESIQKKKLEKQRIREEKEQKLREEEEMKELNVEEEREIRELKIRQEEEMQQLKIRQEREWEEHNKPINMYESTHNF